MAPPVVEKPKWYKQYKALFYGFIYGAIAATIVWYSAGWLPPGKAKRIIAERSDSAVTAVLLPMCIAKSEANPEKLKELAALESPYDRKDFVAKSGWADLSENPDINGVLAEACAVALWKEKTAENKE